jgi:hypothetical protein
MLTEFFMCQDESTQEELAFIAEDSFAVSDILESGE